MPTLEQHRTQMEDDTRQLRDNLFEFFGMTTFAYAVRELLADATVLSPEDVTPTIRSLDSMKRQDLQSMPEPFKGKEIKRESYVNSQEEIIELRQFLEGLLGDVATEKAKKITEVQVKKALINRIFQQTEGTIPKTQIRRLVEHGDFLDDIQAFYNDVLKVTGGVHVTDPDSWRAFLLSKAKIITSPDSKTTQLEVDQEAHRLLFTSRLLGLIPRKVLERLQNLSIKVLGASAAMPTVRLLMWLGAENITVVDDGVVDWNKNPMMGAGGTEMNGQFKVVALLKQLFAYNPYGSFKGKIGRAFDSEDQKSEGSEDVTFEELLDGAGIENPALVLEVVDDAQTKAKLRTWLKENKDKYQELILGWLADTHIPFAGLEKIGEKPFNEPFSDEDMKEFSNIDNPLKMLKMFWRILQKSFPAEHRQMFITVAIGMIPFLSQTPLAAQESSSILVRSLLMKLTEQEYSLKENVEGKNRTAGEAPDYFMQEYKPRDITLIDEILTKIFAA